MKRIAYWVLPILLIGALATPGFSQSQDPKWKDNKEYEDYIAVYNEKDYAKKAALAEKFFVDHKDADPIALTQVYQMMILSYAQSSNWAKTLETLGRMDLAPKLTDPQKLQYFQIGMLAAANSKNNAKTLEYGEKVLGMNANDLNALVTLSSLLSQTLPAEESAKQAQLTRTLDITRRALAQPRPAGTTDAQWNPIQLQLHQTACLVLLNQNKHTESIAECQEALKINGKDSYAWYLIGLSHKTALIDLSKKYNDAVDKYNANRTADPITVDDLRAVMLGAQEIATAKRDEMLDAFARSVAAGGPAGQQAREELQKIFTGTPEELNRLIEDKKSQLGN
jgi:hypothetical protein